MITTPEFPRLPNGLCEVDRVLDDQVFLQPFEGFFDPRSAGPSIPIETDLRMMFLALPLPIGLRDPRWPLPRLARRFCRIGLADIVPHHATLMNITTRCEERPWPSAAEALARVVEMDGTANIPPNRRADRTAAANW